MSLPVPSPQINRSHTRHRWQFIRAGAVDQVIFASGDDIRFLDQLDQKLWVALACPTRGLHFDERTLDLIDVDKDGRVRPPELIAACQWACARLRDPQVLFSESDCLQLSDLDTSRDEGARLAQEARRILELLGRPGADALSLADITDRGEWLAAMRFNGDGVVTPATADDTALRALIEQVMARHGTVSDRHKQTQGVDRPRVDAFFADVESLCAWFAAEPFDQMPLGANTLAAAQAYGALRAKLEDYFARARVAAFDEKSLEALNPSKETYAQAGGQQLSLSATEVAALPLAPVTPAGVLPLSGRSVNPAWSAALATFRQATVAPLLGHRDVLTEDEWLDIRQRLQSCNAWLAQRPDNPASSLSREQLEAALQQRDALHRLIADDAAAEQHNTMLLELEKLVRLRRYLVPLLNNFVSFSAFYRREGAIFQAGTLYMDGRSCELTVHVDDTAKHAALAGLAKTCLAYCDCVRQGRKTSIVAAFTAGDIDFLFVGRNGVFYDRHGVDWDATITKLIENPTSVAQAFFAPYKKFVRTIEEQVAKRAAASEANAQGSLQSLASKLTTAGQAPAAPGAPGAPSAAVATPPNAVPAAGRASGRIDVGTVAAIGVALGSISAVMVGIFAKFIDLGQWIPVALLGIVIAISGPSMLIAWLKLRQRSLGPILDASGWAINGRMKVNVRLGGLLSQTAHVPPGTERVLQDPDRDRQPGVGAIALLVLVIALAVLAWRMNWLDARLPMALQHQAQSAGVSAVLAG
ncbi:hypothetical protein BH11PSE13_BH11PSE13_27100 [soil metagenome]